ncbi:MAG TPA: hypothetical protein VLA43_00850, partial [Longimicrobiales bacterium]|nr:hypothetical protein [Longimicrobiales bacterium]
MRLAPSIILASLAISLTGCDRTGAFGDVSSIVAAMEPELWAEVEEDMYATLEPTIQTVAEERTFTVTFQDPNHESWGRLSQFKQLLLVGAGDEPWMADAVARLDDPDAGERPRIAQVRDVWAR